MNICRRLNELYKLKEYKKILEMDINLNKLNEKEKQGAISIYLKVYINLCDDKMLNNMINNFMNEFMSRDFLLLIEYFYFRNYNYCLNIFLYYIQLCVIDNKLISLLIINGYDKLLKYLDGYYLKFDYDVGYIDETKLKKYKFDRFIVNKICDEINKDINVDRLNLFINRLDSDKMILLDGNNIMYYDNDILFDMVKYLKSLDLIPVVVIDSYYIKQNPNIKTLTEYIFETNNKLYIIKICLLKQLRIISNNNYGGVIYEYEYETYTRMLDVYMKDLIIKFDEDEFRLDEFRLINDYSNCIQVIDEEIFIPNKNNDFFVI